MKITILQGKYESQTVDETLYKQAYREGKKLQQEAESDSSTLVLNGNRVNLVIINPSKPLETRERLKSKAIEVITSFVDIDLGVKHDFAKLMDFIDWLLETHGITLPNDFVALLNEMDEKYGSEQ